MDKVFKWSKQVWLSNGMVKLDWTTENWTKNVLSIIHNLTQKGVILDTLLDTLVSLGWYLIIKITFFGLCILSGHKLYV